MAKELVYHPEHYGGDTRYEHVKVMENWGLHRNAFLYMATKYICRAGKKVDDPAAQDLNKAAWYLRREMKWCLAQNVRNDSNGIENPDAKFSALGDPGVMLIDDVIAAWKLNDELAEALWNIACYWSNQGSDPSGYLSDAIAKLEYVAKNSR